MATGFKETCIYMYFVQKNVFVSFLGLSDRIDTAIFHHKFDIYYNQCFTFEKKQACGKSFV